MEFDYRLLRNIEAVAIFARTERAVQLRFLPLESRNIGRSFFSYRENEITCFYNISKKQIEYV